MARSPKRYFSELEYRTMVPTVLCSAVIRFMRINLGRQHCGGTRSLTPGFDVKGDPCRGIVVRVVERCCYQGRVKLQRLEAEAVVVCRIQRRSHRPIPALGSWSILRLDAVGPSAWVRSVLVLCAVGSFGFMRPVHRVYAAGPPDSCEDAAENRRHDYTRRFAYFEKKTSLHYRA